MSLIDYYKELDKVDSHVRYESFIAAYFNEPVFTESKMSRAGQTYLAVSVLTNGRLI